jgi:hypothetical protein
VVVAWSRHSLASHFVAEEADEGRQCGILVPVLIEPVTPPLGFRSVNAADLTAWQINRQSLQFDQLVKDIDAVLHPPSVSQKDAVEVRGMSPANRRDVQTPPPVKRSIRTLAYAVLVTVIIVGAGYMAVRVQAPLVSPPGESRNPAATEVALQPAPEPERAEKVEPQKIRPSNGEAACYDEAALKPLVASLQTIEGKYNRRLIDILERTRHQQKLVNDFDQIMERGSSTESCILQKLRLVNSLYNDKFLDSLQMTERRQILWKALHDLLLARAQTEKEVDQALEVVNQLYKETLIDILQREETRKALSKK